MRTEMSEKNRKDIAMNLDAAERQVYSDALKNFSKGRTYRNTPDPLRSSLQRDYAAFMVACYLREKKNSRSHALRF